MVTVEHATDGLRVTATAYSLWFRPDRPLVALDDARGVRWAELCSVSSVHSTSGLDDSAVLAEPAAVEEGGSVRVTVAARSSAWDARRTVFECHDDHLAVRVEVEGRGALTDVHLLGGFVSAYARWGSGFQASAADFRSLLNAEPSTPERRVAPASEPASIDVLGGSLPGKGHWFFTPAPLCWALHREATDEPDFPGGWASMGIAGPVAELTFTGAHLEPGERSFAVRLAYEGQTLVDGSWSSPWVIWTFDAPDAYAAIGAHATLLSRLGFVPERTADAPDWWQEPIFCGWGAQCHLAAVAPPARPADLSRQDVYDGLLAHLSDQGVEPGTVVIDDRWETAYGSGEADPERWPDLRDWIATRHAAGQRVLLWWKAWAPDALEPRLCVRNAAGRAIAADPTHPETVAHLGRAMRRMLGRDGYDADGLKVDFTAMTPSGAGMARHGSAWGIALLHRLLAVIHEAATSARPDALVITHAPHPSFADVSGMIRLNDVLRLDDPSPGAPIVEHMLHRARIVRAAMPGVLIDTDGWALPDRRTWRDYLERQPELGVPSLYYATHIDRSGEPLRLEDYAAIRDGWADHRRRLGRPSGPAGSRVSRG